MDFLLEHLRGGGSGCEDTDTGKKDKDGNGCKWYTIYDPDGAECGKHDDNDFQANKMCCHCGGGTGEQPTPAPTPDPNVCKDTNGDATDKEDNNCEWYTENDEHGEHCGRHDDDDFGSLKLCCRCGGGSTSSDSSRLFEYVGSAVPEAEAQILTLQTLGMAVVAMMAGMTALAAVTRRASRRDVPCILAEESDAELTVVE